MLIRDRVTNNKRVKCNSCGRTHALILNRNANPTFIAPEPYVSTGIVLYEDEIMQVGLDRTRWGLGITRSLYKKRSGNVLYTQYIAYCPNCLRQSRTTFSFSSEQYFANVADYIKQEFLAIIDENPDWVYRKYGTKTAQLIPQTQLESDHEEQGHDDSDDDEEDINNNDSEADENTPIENTPIQVGTEVVFLRGNRSDIYYRRDVGKVLFARDNNGTTMLTVLSYRTGQRVDALPCDLEMRTTYRTDFQIGDLVKHNSGSNYTVISVGDQTLMCENGTRTNVLQKSECIISCFDYRNAESLRASVQPQSTTESAQQGVIDIWIHHKVKSL